MSWGNLIVSPRITFFYLLPIKKIVLSIKKLGATIKFSQPRAGIYYHQREFQLKAIV